ncbi:MAG: PDZ domain-containing protein [Myxococcales bacterium]|nr:PDZ domain-containing protein [Myxococcales bacterium]
MLPRLFGSFASRLLLASVGATALACTAVYPEVATPARAVPAGQTLTPPPPDDLFFIRIQGATIPETTRDGRKWDAVGGSAPDPFVKVLAGDKELFRTPTQPNTLTPTWPDGPRANYRIPKGTSVRLELWDSNPINNHPICVKLIRAFAEEARRGVIDLECDSGAKLSMIAEPAHARIGLGMRYEFRSQSIFVTRVALESPAARMGLRGGDQVIRIQGKEVKTLDEAEARSLVNANSPAGVTLTVKKPDGSTLDLTLKDGPIYPMLDDDIPLE